MTGYLPRHAELVSVSIGPLEDIFSNGEDVREDILVRIENEARRTPRFRWMLSGMWTSNFKPEHAARIKRAVSGAMVEDPLPPRPWS